MNGVPARIRVQVAPTGAYCYVATRFDSGTRPGFDALTLTPVLNMAHGTIGTMTRVTLSLLLLLLVTLLITIEPTAAVAHLLAPPLLCVAAATAMPPGDGRRLDPAELRALRQFFQATGGEAGMWINVSGWNSRSQILT